jgi:hypothetical protein
MPFLGLPRDSGGHIMIPMRLTVTIDGALLREARDLTGVRQRSVLLSRGLEALIARESARRLARLGGTEPQLKPIRRRRSRRTR